MPLSGVTFEEKQQELDKRKPPCAREVWDERKNRSVWQKPAVNCAFECEKCGWNPVVKKQRVDRMMGEYHENRARERKAKETAKKGGKA